MFYFIFLSETFVVYDSIKYDIGTISNHNDSIWNNVNYFERTSTHTIFTDTVNQIVQTGITGDVCVELDVNTNIPLSQGLFSIRNGGTQLTECALSSLGLSQDNWYRVKCEIKNNMCTFSCNGVSTTPVDVTGFNRWYIRVTANQQTLFKNLAVYNI